MPQYGCFLIFLQIYLATVLVNLLTSPSRNHPVCVVSLPEGSEDPSDALLPAEDLQHKVAGAAHVVVLTSCAANALTSFLGERLSVFRGAVRTYEAGLDPSDWSPGRHRLALARSIENWEGGSASFGNFLVDNILKLTAYRPVRRDRATSYLDVKQQFQAGQSRFSCVGFLAGSPPSSRPGGVSPGCPPSGSFRS